MDEREAMNHGRHEESAQFDQIPGPNLFDLKMI